jgi:hypothetical protein
LRYERTDQLAGWVREGRGKQGGWIAGARLRGASIDHRGYVLNNLPWLSVLRGEVRGAKEGVKVAMELSLLPITGKCRSTARNASFRNRGGADW